MLAVEKGTLGRSARAKVPLRAADGRIVGQVSVGVLESSIQDKLGTIIPVIALYAGIALLAGLGASLLLSRRLKRQTFGLELRELAELLQEREAMLHGIREGVVALDPEGRIRLVNAEAQRLLGPRRVTSSAGGPSTRSGRAPAPTCSRAGRRRRDLLPSAASGCWSPTGCRATRARPRRGRHPARPHRARAARARAGQRPRLTDAMRAQEHEFSNRMHTLSGLLQLGHHDEAVEFVRPDDADTAFRRALGRADRRSASSPRCCSARRRSPPNAGWRCA